ncbi:hypothetical protein [Bosea sp. PAMC 26642]|uniref:hypothetical protein n=1 Tax=Bosea sp. (strain PAMC 26642) TaxID=1792307 RepID=UPI0007702193|nr:hypothetical protein [Bosea sp. PAMC 26642]AMJ59367.1 hypothetical protein AXW83_02765 [Bosea sp. PAMC 26642]
MSEPADLGTPLVRYPWIIVRLRCHVCPRNAEVRLAALAARYGHRVPIRMVLHAFMSGCPWNPHTELRKPQKYGHRCGAYVPDLNSTRPPDLPPSMTGLSLIEGGKADMLPAEPMPAERRRVGEADDV